MSDPDQPPPSTGREERLAARLRENLHRRKAQARAQTDAINPKDPDRPEQ